MWNRLIAVVEEQARIMIRTAFSTTVREAGDLSAGIFDRTGRMMAQAVTGTPGHVNSMAESVGHFLKKFPADAMKPGDHYITNDPWLGTGHLHDLTVVSPAFHRGKMVGLFANTAHVIDIGGLGMGPEGRSVFEEGMYIPILRCFEQGKPNETFFDFIRAGSRLPVELEGDIYSLCACNDAGARRLTEMMDEFEMEGLEALAEFIFDNSRRATLAEIERLPHGSFAGEIWSDGYEEPVRLAARMEIHADGIEVDFEGTSGLSSRGINVPPAYCRAYACFGIKCVVAPEIPNNWASLGSVPDENSRRMHSECAASLPCVGSSRDRTFVARSDDGLSSPGGSQTGHGRGSIGSVEPAVARRFVGLWPGRGNRPVIGGFRNHHVQFRWNGRSAREGWTGRARPFHLVSGQCPSRRRRMSPQSSYGARNSSRIREALAQRAAVSARSWKSGPRATSSSR